MDHGRVEITHDENGDRLEKYQCGQPRLSHDDGIDTLEYDAIRKEQDDAIVKEIIRMSLMPIDWKNRPRKYCFAPCPEGGWCECRERITYETRELRYGIEKDLGVSEQQQSKDIP